MTSSATAALIHRRVARLQALVRGQQCRKRVLLEGFRRDWAALTRQVNREAFGADEPPFEELADLGFFESADEWRKKGVGVAKHQLLPSSPSLSPPRLPCSTEAAGAGGGGRGAVARPREEVLAELVRVRRAIQERVEALRLEQEQQQQEQQQQQGVGLSGLGLPE